MFRQSVALGVSHSLTSPALFAHWLSVASFLLDSLRAFAFGLALIIGSPPRMSQYS
jgi:hypothetical protein